MQLQDISNYSSSPHRLPTLSVSEALKNLSSTSKKPISTGLRGLDGILQGREPGSLGPDTWSGGLSRGQIAEIYGPPGVGKTTFAMQVAAHELQSGGSVVWIAKNGTDTSHEIPGRRFREIICHSGKPAQNPISSPTVQPSEDILKKFHHFIAPTLSHLLVLIGHSQDHFPPEGTRLIVIDSISSLFATAFPQSQELLDSKETHEKKRHDAVRWAASRKWAVMGDVISTLGRLAATADLVVLLVGQTTTRIRAETGAMLHPALSSTAWDNGIVTRIVLFRDWLFQNAPGSEHESYVPGVRFAGVLKAAGAISHAGLGKTISFVIDTSGLRELDDSTIIHHHHHHHQSSTTPTQHPRNPKRKRDEIAPSQSEEDGEIGSDEEYGWAAEDAPSHLDSLLVE